MNDPGVMSDEEMIMKSVEDFENRRYLAIQYDRRLRVVLDDGAYMPERAYKADAGLDLRTPIYFIVRPGEAVKIDTGVHVAIPEGCVGLLKSKSGLNVNHGITGEGVIDAGYTGSIVACLRNNGEDAMQLFPGDKIIQLVIVPIYYFEPILVDSLDDTDRGRNGFGSTGK